MFAFIFSTNVESCCFTLNKPKLEIMARTSGQLNFNQRKDPDLPTKDLQMTIYFTGFQLKENIYVRGTHSTLKSPAKVVFLD